MRDAFAKEVLELAKNNQDIVLLSGDIGNRMFDKYKEIAPHRFINCGIAEANMMSMAAGMALSGLKPIIYTITPFTTTRCLEQIKIGVAYHEAPVIIVGTGSGLSYSELGPTHHSLEDIAIIKSIPGINILTPSDKQELVVMLREAVKTNKPTYIRIGKKGEPLIFKSNQKLGIGKANVLREGENIMVLTIGPIVNEILEASKILDNIGISISVVTMGSIRPLDHDFLTIMSKSKYKKWISIEEHGVFGGLGTSIVEWLNANNISDIKFKKCAMPDIFIHELGNQNFTRKKFGLDKFGIVEFIKSL